MSEVISDEEVLAAALYAVLYVGHPVYGSTAGWRGGIGGQMSTPGCSMIDPPPEHRRLREWAMEILQDWLRKSPDRGLILHAALEASREDWK